MSAKNGKWVGFGFDFLYYFRGLGSAVEDLWEETESPFG
jgi:hypothetical protein